MLHKIFRKRSFRRPQKSVDCSNRRGVEVAEDSDSYDDSCPASGEPSPTTAKKDVYYRAPVATREDGGLCSETESSKKVTFNEPMNENWVKLMTSPDGGKGKVNTDLFDGNVLDKLQAGDIGIADFLRKSPTGTPPLDAKTKNRSLSDSGIPLKRHLSVPTPRRQTLLDRAHSMKVKPKKHPPPVQKTVSATSMETTIVLGNMATGNMTKKRREDLDAKSCSSVDMKPSNPRPINGNLKHRFSRSLETLAQEVFGEEFQKYLAGASVSTAPKKLQKSLSYQCSTERSSTSTITNSDEIRQSNVAPQQPGPIPKKKIESLHVDMDYGTGETRLTSPMSNCSGGESTCHNCTHDALTYSSLLSPIGTHNTWMNEGYPSPASDISSINNVDNEASKSQLQRMKPIQEGDQSGSSSRNASVDSESKENPGSDTTPANNNTCLLLRRRKFSRLSTSDSQYVNPGSFNDGDDLNASGSSLMDLNFPPPPPVDEDHVTPQITYMYTDGFKTLSNESFDSDSRCATSGSSNYQYDITSDNTRDPIIDSLMSVVPLPEEQEQLAPVLSKALGEIVSEIIASRRKLERMMKAIEIHQQVLKDQNIQIQRQNKEIAEMRKTSYALNNLSLLSHASKEDSPVPNIVHARSRESTNDSNKSENLCNHTQQSVDSSPPRQKFIPSVARESSANFQSKSKNRQSREIVELNHTLDKLLNQCSALQQTPTPSADEQADSDTSSRTFPLSSNVSIRRVKSMPSRKLKHSKNSVLDDKTE